MESGRITLDKTLDHGFWTVTMDIPNDLCIRLRFESADAAVHAWAEVGRTQPDGPLTWATLAGPFMLVASFVGIEPDANWLDDLPTFYKQQFAVLVRAIGGITHWVTLGLADGGPDVVSLTSGDGDWGPPQ